MRIVFMGSPEEVVSPLNLLLSEAKKHGHEITAIISQPAKPAGRKGILTDPPVAMFAKQNNLPTFQPEKISGQDFLKTIAKLSPDLAITAAYGQILSQDFLNLFKKGVINIHPSLLPEYRGAAPVQTALLDGKEETGITILFTVKKLDAGPIIAQKKVSIGREETAEKLLGRLFEIGGELLCQTLSLLESGDFQATPQDEAKASKSKKITKEHGKILWTKGAKTIYNEWRAFYPWPGSFTFLEKKRILLTRLRFLEITPPLADMKNGETLFDNTKKILKTWSHDSWIIIERLKPEGSKEISALDFWNSRKGKPIAFTES